MKIFKILDGYVSEVLSELGIYNVTKASVEYPRNNQPGVDFSTNAAFVAAKEAKMSPQDLANKIAEKLSKYDLITNVEVVGKGFVNFNVQPEVWISELIDIISKGKDYGSNNIGGGISTCIEFVSANPTGPLHVGHTRGAVYGDVLANLLTKSGYNVTKEYYINDAGSQVDKLCKSLYLRYAQVMGFDAGEWTEDLYPGEYLIDAAKELAKQPNDDGWLERNIREISVNAMLDLIKDDLKNLNINFNLFTSEFALVKANLVQEAVDSLKNKGLVYTGVLPKPKSHDEDWEEREQLIFKSTAFGDDVDRPLQKANGSWTYFATDVAYHYDKYKRGFKNIINVWGADHGGYVSRITAATKALSDNQATIDVKLCQMVHLYEDGAAVRMGKRSGKFVTVKDLINEVGSDVVRFTMMSRKPDAQLDFDLELAKQQAKENTLWYVQYAHARSHSALEIANKTFNKTSFDYTTANMNLLTSDEVNIIKKMVLWSKVVETATVNHEPHIIAFYLQELAQTLHSFWNMGKQDTNKRFVIKDNLELSKARVALIQAVGVIIADGLDILGIKALEKM